MATRDYSGFQAIVNSVERLRETVNQEADKQLVVTRTIRDYQRSSLVALEQLVENFRTSTAAATRHNFALPDRLQIKNLQLQAGSVTLSARSVIVETKGQLTGNQKAKQDNEQLAKALGSEIKKIKISGGGLGNPLQLIGLGLFIGIGFKFGEEFAKGFQKSIKKNIGLSFRSFGQNVGTGVTDPRQAVKDTIKARRDWQVRKESTKQAIELAKSQNVNVDPNKLNIFTVAGMAGKSGKASSFRKRALELSYGKENINVVPVSNPNTDPSVSRDKNPLQYQAEAASKLLHNLLIKGYNPDAVKMASQVISAKQKNPEIKILLEGGSQGGFIVEEVVEILKQAGITDVQGVGIGTPNLGLGFNNKNYKNFFAENEKYNEEPLYKFFGISRKQSNDKLKDYAPLSQPSNHEDYYQNPEVVEAIGINPKGLNEKIVSHFQSLSIQANAAQGAFANNPKARNAVGNKLFEEIKQAKALLQELKQKNLFEDADEALSLYDEFQESLADVFSEQYLKFKDVAGNAQNNYQKIAQQVAELSGVAPNKLPQLSNKTIDKEGVNAEIKDDFIYLSKNIADKLARGEIDESVVETLIHEIRHGVQKYVKKLIDVEDLTGEGAIDKRAIPLLQERATESVNSIERSVGRQLSTEERDKVYSEELDAYGFEFVNARKILTNVNKQLKQPQPEKLINRYFVYIDNLIEQAKKEATNRIKALIPNYENLTIEERKTSVASFSAEVNKEKKKFRMAVEDGEDEVAVEIGERILALIQPIRAAYEDLLATLPPDASGTESIRGQLRNLTNLQNEVLRGQPNQKGRAKKGLAQIVGNQTASGFVFGVEARIKEVEASGEELGEAAIEGAKNRLGIASPSKEFEEIGKQSAEGYSQGLEDGQTEVKSALDSFWDSLENIPILGWFVKAGRAIARFVADLFNPKQQSRKQNEPNQVPVEPDSPNRSDQRPNQSGDRPADSGTVGSVPLPANSPDDGNPQAVLFGRQRDYFLGRRLSGTAGAIVPSARQNFNESAKKVAAEIELAPGFWVDTEKLNDQKLIRKVQTKIIVFWEQLRRNLNKEVARTLTGILGTIPGTVIGRGLTGSATGGYLGGLTGRLIAETGFDDVANFRSLQKQGLSPATAEFWQQFGNNRQFLPNKLRKAGVGYVTGSVIGKGIGDVMQVSGASRLLSTLLPSWLETGIGDAINRTIKTIADPNIDLEIPKLPPAANKFLSAPLHALGNSVAAQGFLGNLGLSFLEGQTKTSLMPIRDALTGAGKAVGGQSVWGEYLGDRFSSLGIGTIQQTAKASGRGVAGLIAPGMPGQIRDFIADQVINNAILDGVVRDQAAPYLAEKATGDIAARAVKVPLSGKVSGAVNKTLDKIDPFPLAPPNAVTDEQLLIERQKRLQKRKDKGNVVENLYIKLDKSIDATTKSVANAGNNVLDFFNNIRLRTNQFARKTAGLDEPIKLIDKYVLYLDQLIEDASQAAEEQIRALIPNYQNLTIGEKRQLAQGYGAGVAKEIKKFRMAIEDGEDEIAVEIGERILALIQPVKAIYDNLLDILPPDLSGTRSIRGQRNNLVNVQNEVIKGQPNMRGRSKTGLVQIVGQETASGFIQGIEAKLNQVKLSGDELASTAIEAAKKRLDIQSPSKVFEQIGQFVVEGFQKGINGFKNLSTDSIGQFTQKADEQIANTINASKQGFDDFLAKIYEKFPIIKELQDLILGFAASLALGNLLEGLVGQITQLANASFTAVLELESMRVALTSVSGSAEAGAKGLRFVSEEAKRLGIDLRTAEEAYAGLKAATQFSPIRGIQADRVFSVFAETAALRGLSNEQQGNMFGALAQIANKPLSAEEVKGQLGEIPALAFESTLARALGINPAQLADMMKGGELQGVDVLPKVAAQYAAENAVISASAETTAQAMARFQNAILNLQRSFEGWVTGSRVFFNLFAVGVEKLSEIIPIVVKYLGAFSAALLLDLGQIAFSIAKLQSVQAFLINLTKALQSLLLYALPAIKTFIGQFILITLAIEAVSNAFNILKNDPFPELTKNIKQSKIEAEALDAAFDNLGKSTQGIRPDLPTEAEASGRGNKLKVTRGWNILGVQTDWNLEGVREFFGGSTLGEQEAGKFSADIADQLSQVDRVLRSETKARQSLEEIKKIDKELTTIRSRRFQIPSEDREAYNESLEAEKKLLESRDEYLKETAQFQQALQGNQARIEGQLKLLDELAANKGITAEAEASIRKALEERLKAVEQTKTTFEDLTASLAKSVNALSLALRNLNENAAFFNETLERNATNARVQFMRRARAAGVGSQVRDIGVDQIDRTTLESRLVFLRDQLGAVNNALSKPDFSALLDELKQQAEDAGINLENTATIDRLIGENRSQQETAVLNALKEQIRLKTEIGQTEENLERSIQSASSTIRDLGRSVDDFFFNLTQQIKEALVEVDRILNQLKYGRLKTRLQRALVPGSDTFVNGLVSQIQGIFDQASSIVEQILGQRSASINFAGEQRSLQLELENFTRNLSGATEAVELFRQGLLGGNAQGVSNSSILPVPKPPGKGRGQLPPPPSSNVGQASNANPFNPLFELLFKGEGNENSVNRGRAGDTPKGLRSLFGKDAAQFTVGEIMKLQQQRRIFAVGMPQFIPSTLKGAVQSSGISLDTPFNLQTQQQLAIELFKNKRPEIWNYLTGKSNNLIEAAQGMAREWAAIGLSYAEAGRGVGVSRYSGTAGNAASISPSQVQQALAQTRQNLSGQAPSSASTPSPDAQRARSLTDTLTGIKNRQLNLGDEQVRQEIESFILNLQQTRETILRQMGDSIRTSRQSVIDAQNSLIDTRSQFSPQTQESQLETEMRGVENQFRGLDTQLFEQERGLQDNIKGLNNLLEQITPVIEVLRSSGNEVDRQSAEFLQGLVGQLETDKKTYSGMLTEIQSLRGELKQGKIDAENFVQAQAKLRAIQADLERIGTELTIAQQQNNLEQERAIALLQSRQQLEVDLLTIANDFADNEAERTQRLELARQQAQLREKEIEYQFQSKKLSQEMELINQRLTIAQGLSNLGKRNELELLQSQKQLEQEILEIKKQYPDLAQQELRIQLAKEQARQRELGIENSYRNDRLQREQELVDMDGKIAEARAEQLEASGDVFGAANLREQAAFTAELLRYEQEIEAIRQRYPDDTQRADELIRKATILQGLNLERIDRQFKDLGETIRDVATSAFSTFLEDTLTGTKSIGDAFLDMTKSILQSLAQIAARMAISGLFRWMNIGGFADGGTVPNFAIGDTVKSAKNAVLPFRGIQEALRKEGPKGVLAVFTPGEEILSLRTGEAQRYQSLKARLGKNPLAKIGHFADGGTISENLLANLNNSAIPSGQLPVNFGQTVNQNYRQGDRSVTVNVSAPNPSAFNASERQIGRVVAEYLSRV